MRGLEADPGDESGRGAASLSPAGRARREEMLRVLKAAVVRRRRRRSAFRWTAIAALPIAAGAVFFTARGLREPPGPSTSALIAREEGKPASPAPPPSPRGAAGGRIEVVRDDPGILARYASSASVGKEVWIGDEELLDLLRAAGRPSGLIRANGKVTITAETGARREGIPARGIEAPRG